MNNIKRTGYLGMRVGFVLGFIYYFGGLAMDTLVSIGYLDADDTGTPRVELCHYYSLRCGRWYAN